MNRMGGPATSSLIDIVHKQRNGVWRIDLDKLPTNHPTQFIIGRVLEGVHNPYAVAVAQEEDATILRIPAGKTVSRRHLEIVYDPARRTLQLTNRSSSNVPVVEKEQLKGSKTWLLDEITDGLTISLGSVIFFLHIGTSTSHRVAVPTDAFTQTDHTAALEVGQIRQVRVQQVLAPDAHTVRSRSAAPCSIKPPVSSLSAGTQPITLRAVRSAARSVFGSDPIVEERGMSIGVILGPSSFHFQGSLEVLVPREVLGGEKLQDFFTAVAEQFDPIQRVGHPTMNVVVYMCPQEEYDTHVRFYRGRGYHALGDDQHRAVIQLLTGSGTAIYQFDPRSAVLYRSVGGNDSAFRYCNGETKGIILLPWDPTHPRGMQIELGNAAQRMGSALNQFQLSPEVTDVLQKVVLCCR